MRIIAIDPGSKGGAVEVVRGADAKITPTRYHVLEWQETGKKRPTLNICKLFDFVTEGGKPDLVVLESVQFMGRSEKSAFGAVQLVGTMREILGALKVLRIPYVMPGPREWQKATIGPVAKVDGEGVDARKKRIKRAVVTWCQRTYPDFSLVPERCRVPHEGLVDALAMAHWGAG